MLYLWPERKVDFDELYARVDPAVVESLISFRRTYPLRHVQVDGADWDYIAVGEGDETIVFLHGMAGSYDVWWRQIEALEGRYRIISVTYPPVQNLEALANGVLAILEREGVGAFNVVGTSLGGYLAQYLMARHPDRVRRAVLANTFPPNELIARQTRTLGALLPVLPERVVISTFRRRFRDPIYPASGNDELTLAFLTEISITRMSKAHVLGRYRCVIERFTAQAPPIPILIIESDNDPLIEPTLRERLKSLYPGAAVHTFSAAGHFPHLNRPAEYARVLADFLSEP